MPRRNDIERIVTFFETAQLPDAMLFSALINQIVKNRVKASQPKEAQEKPKRHRSTKAEIEAAKQQTAA